MPPRDPLVRAASIVISGVVALMFRITSRLSWAKRNTSGLRLAPYSGPNSTARLYATARRYPGGKSIVVVVAAIVVSDTHRYGMIWFAAVGTGHRSTVPSGYARS